MSHTFSPSNTNTDTNTNTNTNANTNTTLRNTNSTASENQPCFYLMVTGQIESTSFPSNIDNLYCRYSFVSGLDWTILHGIDTGISQTARKVNRNQPTIVWNFPIDLSYQSTNIQGWPRICLSVYGLDWFGRDVVRGYGCLMCPITPGNHVQYVHMYAPESSSPWQRFLHFWTGKSPEFYDSRFVSRGDGRGVTRVKCEGTVKVVLDITTRGIESLGYDVGN